MRYFTTQFMTRCPLFLLCLFITAGSLSQNYIDYVGAGHLRGVTITTSHDTASKNGLQTGSGEGLMPDLEAASRFLAQATLGADYETIESVAQMGISAWLDNQFSLPVHHLEPYIDALVQMRIDSFNANGETYDDSKPGNLFRFSWWQKVMTAPDILRHRIALALSEILVVSEFSDFGHIAYALGNYYDILSDHAFGNYRDLLLDVTLSQTMGQYLSHWRNPKTDTIANSFPDENYAREFQQLFSIGLYMLNQDGTRQTDGGGNWIPTYSNTEIIEFAKIFTGLGTGGTNSNFWWWQSEDFQYPMKMFEDYHEPGEKYLHNHTVMGGQTGMQDIAEAIDNLFNHPNVGPFIGRLLIQRLVKSNPSKEYISRVAGAFNDNGSGIRGDMKAVIKAILLDEEARDCSWMQDPAHGMLREPIVRYAHICRALNASSPAGDYHNSTYWMMVEVKQRPLGSPSVFNFFLPDHQPKGPIKDLDLVAPEFQIVDASSSIGYINQVYRWSRYTNGIMDINSLYGPWYNFTPDHYVNPDISDEVTIANDVNALLNRLDIIFTYGNMSQGTRDLIYNAVNSLSDPTDRVDLAIYLIMISPDYCVMK